MRIVVAVKQAGQLDEDFELSEDGRDADPDYLDWELNEWDTFAIEEAIRHRDSLGGEVTLISVGDEKSVDALRAGLAMGADGAIHVDCEDDAIVDPLAVSQLLARAVQRLSPDLVLLGVQSSDAATAVTGSAVAALAGLPQVAVVRRLEIEASSAVAHRELEGGTIEVLRVALPALLTIQTGINEPRYATLRAIKQAEQHPLEVLTPADLGLDGEQLAASAGSARLAAQVPPESSAELLEGTAAEVAARVAEIVRERTAA